MGEELLLPLLVVRSGPVRNEDDGAGVEPFVTDLLFAIPALNAKLTLFIRKGLEALVFPNESPTFAVSQ
jgi:hypothetical protein